MVGKSRRGRERFRAGLVVLDLLVLSLLVSHALAGQVTTALSDTRMVVGETTTLVITVEHEEPQDIAAAVPELPWLDLIQGPSTRPLSLLDGDERLRVVELRYEFRAVASGRYIFPAIDLNVAGQQYQSEARLVEVGEARNRALVPFLARWTTARDELFVGQAVPVAIEAYNAVEYFFPRSIDLEAPANAIFQEVQGLGSIAQSEIDGVTLYSMPVAVFMLTPTSAGTLRLQPATVANDEVVSRAPPAEFVVRPLPDAVGSTGAVGRFAYQVESESSELSESDQLRVRIRVSGEGNLHFLQIPLPELTGLDIVSDRVVQRFEPSDRGYTGLTERVLVLRPTRAGSVRIRPASFPAFDPDTGTVRRHIAESIGIEVLPVSDTGTTVAPSGAPPLTVDEIGALERINWFDDPGFLGLFAPGFLFLIAIRFWKPQAAAAVLIVFSSILLLGAAADRLPGADLLRAQRRIDEGRDRAAISATERAHRAAPDSPGINYNLGVLYSRVGDTPRAVFALRETIRLAPSFSPARELLRELESGEGLERTIAPPHRFHPDLFLLVSALLANGLLVGAGLARGRYRGTILLVGLILGVVLLSSLVGLLATTVRYGDQLAVTVHDVTLTRIPGRDASGWLSVPGGIAVDVVSQDGDAVLVRTSLGLEGWIDLTDLIWKESPLYGVVRYRGFVTVSL